MASTLVKNDIHIIFHVKSTGIVMREKDLSRIFSYIGGVIRSVGGIPIEIGGVVNHVHILTSLPKTKSLSDFVRIIKTESSLWMKNIDQYYDKFSWQDGYGAFSISPNQINRTINYIRNQKEHHKTMTFQSEYKSFLDGYGIKYDERYIFDDKES